MQINKRDETFDIMKGIGIIAVVACHCCCPMRPFTAFHLPLFMFASGYFHPLKPSETWNDLLHVFFRRICQISIPTMLICCFMTALQPLCVKLHWLGEKAYTFPEIIFRIIANICTLGTKGIPLMVEPLWFTVLWLCFVA